jgi:hypothetical protein
VLVAVVLGPIACTAEVAAVSPPRDYYYYPYTYYDGHIVYYIDGSWYYPNGGRWYSYRHAPAALQTSHYYRSPYYRAPASPYYRTPPYGRGGGPRERHERHR